MCVPMPHSSLLIFEAGWLAGWLAAGGQVCAHLYGSCAFARACFANSAIVVVVNILQRRYTEHARGVPSVTTDKRVTTCT
jgi:hypothetical protein